MESYSETTSTIAEWENTYTFRKFLALFHESEQMYGNVNFSGDPTRNIRDFSFILISHTNKQDGYNSLDIRMTYTPGGEFPRRFPAHFHFTLSGNNGESYQKNYWDYIRDKNVIKWKNIINHRKLLRLFNPTLKPASLQLKVVIRIFLTTETSSSFLHPIFHHSLPKRQKLLCHEIKNFFYNHDHDCTLVVNGLEYSTHKLNLLAFSPVFVAMFRTNLLEKKTNKIEMGECEPETVEALVEYFNTGKYPPEELALEMMLLTHRFQMNTLTSICVDNLIQNLTIGNPLPSNVILCYYWADVLELPKLKIAAGAAFFQNFKDVIKSEHFQQMAIAMPILVKKLYKNFGRSKLFASNIHQIKKLQMIPVEQRNKISWAKERTFFKLKEPPIDCDAHKSERLMVQPKESSTFVAAKVQYDCTVQHLFTHPDYYRGFNSEVFCSQEEHQMLKCRLRMFPHGRTPEHGSEFVIIEVEVDVEDIFLDQVMDVSLKLNGIKIQKQSQILNQKKTVFVFDDVFPFRKWQPEQHTFDKYKVHAVIAVSVNKIEMHGQGPKHEGPILLNDMMDLCISGLGGDFILMFGDHRFLAHTQILSARSARMARIIANSSKNVNGICIYTNQCEECYAAIRNLMIHVYTGHYPKFTGRNSCLKALAEAFEMDFLFDDCRETEGIGCKPALHEIWWSPEYFELVAKKIFNFPGPTRAPTQIEEPNELSKILANKHPMTYGFVSKLC